MNCSDRVGMTPSKSRRKLLETAELGEARGRWPSARSEP
jgi:hypothetical protein